MGQTAPPGSSGAARRAPSRGQSDRREDAVGPRHKETNVHRTKWRRSAPVRTWIGVTATLVAGAPAALANGGASPAPTEADRFSLEPTTSPVVPEEPVSEAANATGGWSYEPTQGMHWESDGGEVKVWLGGRIQLDWVWQTASNDIEDTFGRFTDGVEFRRARLYTEGTLYERVGFKFDYDFSENSESKFNDVWMSLNDLVQEVDLKIGHMKEPQGLERLTDSNYLTFMERSIANGLRSDAEGRIDLRNTGAMVADTVGANHINWAVGVFRPTNEYGDDTQGTRDAQYIVSARVAGAPLYSNEGEDVVHLGASFSYLPPNDDGQYVAATRPENNQAPTVLNVTVPDDNSWTAGLEAAWVFKQLSIQSEYMLTHVDASTGGNAYFRGFYVFASWFLTGEHRPYKPNGGVFGRVIPNSNFGEAGGGAWELALRYSRLDLEDNGWDGGELNDITAGVNWYLNPNARVMMNYVHADIDASGDIDGSSDAVMLRFQVDF
jgi:phosphate-selective porin OprO/OprP